ncbi:MAG: hypothetical protein WAU42_13185 [Solirubrobacteraceae bacterium]
MTRKIWISSALALAAAMLVLAPTAAFAGSPLLSGYGGPGAGEQAILGSTLVGGSGGGAGGSPGSGGSGGANLSGSAGVSTSSVGGVSSTGSGSARGSGVRAAKVGSGSGETASKGGTSQGGRSTGVGGAAGAYVYPTSQGSLASASPLTGISSGDVLLLVGILVTLGLVAALTLRLSRLQS